MKKKIRAEILDKMEKLAAQKSQKEQQENELIESLLCLDEWKKAKIIALTYAMDHELDTKKIINYAFSQNKQVVLPKTQSGGRMDFFTYVADTPLELTKFGVLEPISDDLISTNDIDLIIVPGVGFTKDGKRLGYGGGFYDRYLADFSGDTISLALDEQMIDDLELEPHDILVNQVICRQEGGQI